MSPERRAVLLLLGLALLGQGVRVALGRPGVPPGQLLLQGGGPPGAPRAHRDSSLAHARLLAAGDRIDLDRAAAAEIARLPRVGPGLARAIVADREHDLGRELEGLVVLDGELAELHGVCSLSAQIP